MPKAYLKIGHTIFPWCDECAEGFVIKLKEN